MFGGHPVLNAQWLCRPFVFALYALGLQVLGLNMGPRWLWPVQAQPVLRAGLGDPRPGPLAARP